MKTLSIVLLLSLILTQPVFAERYEIKSRTPDFYPNDGFLEAGSYANPYIIIDESGQQVGTIRTRTPDFAPNDGFLEAGSYSNPYIFEWGE